jgi:hypothetical protein
MLPQIDRSTTVMQGTTLQSRKVIGFIEHLHIMQIVNNNKHLNPLNHLL